ncbi:MAG: MlaE family lipid ABC transporter permease subunit [Stenomitos rutilans HA7619-LM2]|jgi:phospholipid/cholesterol/gamma-HCH transport system permease protein|nr:MlaE family lipid ABC transporter permease subunit [Stenomitos rutilans HA7619-LM2]
MNETLSSLEAWNQRLRAAVLLAGRVIYHLLTGKIDRRNTIEQMKVVGPQSLSIVLITAAFIGMVFTIQVSREFLRLGAGSAVGGILAIALSRELSPILTAVVVAGRVGAAFAAELGTMRVSEQIDALYMLKTDPVDYLVVPRVVACALMLPGLAILSFFTGMAGGLLISTQMYDMSPNVFLSSAHDLMTVWDIFAGPIKGIIFGMLIAVIGCSWGLTTSGGAKGVGQSTTTSVVTSILAIIISDFFLSWIMFTGVSDAGLQGF